MGDAKAKTIDSANKLAHASFFGTWSASNLRVRLSMELSCHRLEDQEPKKFQTAHYPDWCSSNALSGHYRKAVASMKGSLLSSCLLIRRKLFIEFQIELQNIDSRFS
jgi:hypothetical protein